MVSVHTGAYCTRVVHQNTQMASLDSNIRARVNFANCITNNRTILRSCSDHEVDAAAVLNLAFHRLVFVGDVYGKQYLGGR